MNSVQLPTNGIHHQESNCTLNVDGVGHGVGVLFIAGDKLTWRNSLGNGIVLHYPSMAVHAISKDTSTFPQECMYVMYNEAVFTTNNDGMSSDDDDEESQLSEVRFIPSDSDNLKKMYDAMCDCQCLHPDEEDSDYEEGGVLIDQDMDASAPIFSDNAAGEGFFTGPEGFDQLTPQGIATMQRLEAMLGGQGQIPADNLEGSGDGLPESISNLHINGHANGVDDNGQFDDAESDEN